MTRLAVDRARLGRSQIGDAAGSRRREGLVRGTVRRGWALATIAVLLLGACSDDAGRAADQGAAREASDETGDGGAAQSGAPSVVPENIAARIEFDDGPPIEIDHSDLDVIVEPTVAAQEFVDAFYLGSAPADLPAVVLTQLIAARSAEAELASRGGSVLPSDRAEAEQIVVVELAQRLTGSPEPLEDARRIWDDVIYIRFLAELVTAQIALARHLEDSAGPADGDPCLRQIVVETERAARAALAELQSGAEFFVVAIERSIGSSAARGGDLGCAPPDAFVAEFATAVIDAEVGEVVGPFETPFGWHLIVVEGYEVDGARLATVLLEGRQQRATITVDERIGTWNGTEVVSPSAGD
ncbi:MAG: peptidylprolyl isomerase [Acidimicrobiia bacterium]|nr:peptidylprolyl isomerase [Acidimicrobiia bacterium]